MVGETHSIIETTDLAAEEVNRFCKIHGVTTANLVHIAWALVLRCFTGAEDVCFGYLTSGRDIPVDDIDAAIELVRRSREIPVALKRALAPENLV